MCTPSPICPSDSEYFLAEAGLQGPLEFDGDPDIAGIGVVTSFLIYSVITMFLANFSYFFLDGLVHDRFYNNLDLLIKDKAQKGLKTAMGPLTPWFWLLEKMLPKSFSSLLIHAWRDRIRMMSAEKLQSICLQLADTQLITSASILIVLYSNHCTLTQYHFYIGSELATLSFITFQAILITVVDVLHKSLFMRIWRHVWILIIFAAIIASRLLQWNDYFMADYLYGVPVQCVIYKLNHGEYYTPREATFMSIEIAVLLWALWSISTLLFPVLPEIPPFRYINCFVYWVLQWPSRLLVRTQAQTPTGKIKKLIATVLVAIALPIREIIYSQGFDLLRVYTMLIAASYGIFYERDRAASHGRKDEENSWGFGQILPLLLLALPLSTFIDELWCKSGPFDHKATQTSKSRIYDQTNNLSPQLQSLPVTNTSETRGPVPSPFPENHLSTSNPRLEQQGTDPLVTPLNRSFTFHRREARVNKIVNPTLEKWKLFRSRRLENLPTTSHESQDIENSTGISQPLETLEGFQRKIDDLESQWFENKWFQFWILFLVAGLYAVATYLVVEVGVPL